jgi:hypothetical protein
MTKLRLGPGVALGGIAFLVLARALARHSRSPSGRPQDATTSSRPAKGECASDGYIDLRAWSQVPHGEKLHRAGATAR